MERYYCYSVLSKFWYLVTAATYNAVLTSCPYIVTNYNLDTIITDLNQTEEKKNIINQSISAVHHQGEIKRHWL